MTQTPSPALAPKLDPLTQARAAAQAALDALAAAQAAARVQVETDLHEMEAALYEAEAPTRDAAEFIRIAEGLLASAKRQAAAVAERDGADLAARRRAIHHLKVQAKAAGIMAFEHHAVSTVASGVTTTGRATVAKPKAA